MKHDQGTDQPGTYVVLEPTNTRAAAQRQLAMEAAHREHQRQVLESRQRRQEVT